MVVNNRNRAKLKYRLAKRLKAPLMHINMLSDEQLTYVYSYSLKSSYLEACAGSGKTEVIGIKTAFEISRWKNNVGGIATITFTNSAACELARRIRKYTGIKSELFPHFIGTFDSWLHNFILQPYCHYLTGYTGIDGDKSIRIIADDSHAHFLHNYNTIITTAGRAIPYRVTDYHFTSNGAILGHSDAIKRALHTATENERRQLVNQKKAFFRAGFSTYSDAEALCVALLRKFAILPTKLALRFPVVTIDECQDLSDTQIEILDILKQAGAVLHFVGDLNQSIYDFREVNPQNTRNYLQANGFANLKLTNNYRSCSEIVGLSGSIMGIGNIKAMTPTKLPNPCILWQYDPANFSSLPRKFEELVLQSNLAVEKSAIISRGKSTVDELRTQTNVREYSKTELFAIALNCWFKPNRDTADLKNAIDYIGRAFCLLAYNGRARISNNYCPEGLNPIEWRILLKRFLNSATTLYPFENENAQPHSWRTWVPLLKTFLQTYWRNLPNPANSYNDISAKLRAPNGQAAVQVNSITNSTSVHNKFRTTTIHGVKGETLDAVMLVSHPNGQSKGGHYSHWRRTGAHVEEHIRFAYVACSRPTQLLVLATPRLNAADLATIQGWGFVPQPYA